MLFEGIAKRFDKIYPSAAKTGARVSGMQSIAVAQVEPAGMECTRGGLRFMLGNSAAITGIAPVQTLPTTAAQWTIWNAESRKTYFFEELGVYLTSGTPGVGGVLLACIFQSPAQTGSSNAGATVSSQSKPFGNASSSAIVKSGVTITTPAAPVWYPVASNPSPQRDGLRFVHVPGAPQPPGSPGHSPGLRTWPGRGCPGGHDAAVRAVRQLDRVRHGQRVRKAWLAQGGPVATLC